MQPLLAHHQVRASTSSAVVGPRDKRLERTKTCFPKQNGGPKKKQPQQPFGGRQHALRRRCEFLVPIIKIRAQLCCCGPFMRRVTVAQTARVKAMFFFLEGDYYTGVTRMPLVMA